MDADTLQRLADRYAREQRHLAAIGIYLHLAEGDPSLDAGALGHAIASCYERLGHRHEARYWYARAHEENPAIDLYRSDFDRTRSILIDDLLAAS